MIDFSYLYAGVESGSTPHRYGQPLNNKSTIPSQQVHAVAASASERHPVVVWNMTRSCNLKCIHCYTNSENRRYEGELSTEEGKRFFDDLARFKIPALLLSGGEPLMRPDFFELAEYARKIGLRVVLSTNGLLLTPKKIARLKELGFTYIGISLDGMEETHDHFRGRKGAFAEAMASFRGCVEVGLKVGLRLTLTSHTAGELPQSCDFLERERIPRVCCYQLAPAGRGVAIELLKPEASRRAIAFILEKTLDFKARNVGCEILTVDNHCDGPFLLLKLKEAGDPRAAQVEEMLRWNGGGTYSSGVGIANVDFVGDVHADQFWMTYSFGNVRSRPFSEIWMDQSDPLMKGLKNRKALLKGRCGSCRWLDHCGGALRSRAAQITGDPWAADPACYLTDQEIAKV